MAGAFSECGTMLAYFSGTILCSTVSFRGASDIVNLCYVCVFIAVLLTSFKPRKHLEYKELPGLEAVKS